jgi:hypothetical protein
MGKRDMAQFWGSADFALKIRLHVAAMSWLGDGRPLKRVEVGQITTLAKAQPGAHSHRGRRDRLFEGSRAPTLSNSELEPGAVPVGYVLAPSGATLVLGSSDDPERPPSLLTHCSQATLSRDATSAPQPPGQ